MKASKIFSRILVGLLLVTGLLFFPLHSILAGPLPTFSITSVVTDTSVTIHTYNFPAGQTFTVRMGDYGTLAIGGTVVGTTDSGAGGSLTATYAIPDGLKGALKIAIRMDSSDGYYAYNWFNNKAGGSSSASSSSGSTSTYSGIPTFSISSVVKDDKVDIKTANFPAGLTFTVRIGAYGTLGIGGTVVGTTDSGAGGSFEASYAIPDALKGSQRLAIRMDATAGFFAYNWFWNKVSSSTSGSSSSGGSSSTPGYTGIPTFSIQSVEKDSKVTISAHNFPAGVTFKVLMGAYGTLGVGGVEVTTTDSGDGGAFEKTYDIPDSLKGSQRIAIRLDSGGDFFAYNWFWNNAAAGGSSSSGGTVYTGIPTFNITTVVKDDKVTITAHNLPAGMTFTARMGAYGTLALGGIGVGSTDSGAGGTLTATYDIPDSLKGSQRIAIRLDAPGGFFAYNWFWNNSN
jgi:hypothetical protein